MKELQFDAVDAGDPQNCIAFLDTASSLEDVQRFKRRSHEMLRVHDGDCVLDVGCGTGDDVRALAARVGVRGRAVGVDASQSMIAEAIRRSSRGNLPVLFYQGDVYKLPFPTASFNACRADRLLHILDAPLAALREIVRVTAPDGRVVVGEPDWSSLQVSGVDPGLVATILGAIAAGADDRRSTGKRLPELFRSAGISVDEIEVAVLEIRDLQQSLYLFQLNEATRRAASLGLIEHRDADRFLDALAQSAGMGQLCCSLTGYTVAGTPTSNALGAES